MSGRLRPEGRAGLRRCRVAAGSVCRTPARLLGAGQGRALPRVGARVTSTSFRQVLVLVLVLGLLVASLTCMAEEVEEWVVAEVASIGRPAKGQLTMDLVRVMQRGEQVYSADDGNNRHTRGLTVKTCRLLLIHTIFFKKYTEKGKGGKRCTPPRRPPR